MIRKLYDEDNYCREFTAHVLSCEPAGTGYSILLDRTAFFPEGGGQAADTGTLDGIPVTDVQMDVEGEIRHYTTESLEVRKTITGRIDWEQRFRRMQNHSGEHLISGLIHSRFGYKNVGFHLGGEDVTMDYSGELTRDQLDSIEDAANHAVAENVTISAVYPSLEELTRLCYRSKKELTGAVRIVTIPGYDVCACCAPHVHHTGEIGTIKLLDFMRYKGGVRVHMQCGLNALEDYRERYTQTAAIAAMLSASQKETVAAVQRLMAEKDACGQEIRQLKIQLAELQVAAVKPTAKPVCLFGNGLDADMQRRMVNGLSQRCAGLCAVFSGKDDDGYTYVAGGHSPDLRALGRRMNEELNGRGGGSAEMLQGRVTASKTQIEAFFTSLSE